MIAIYLPAMVLAGLLGLTIVYGMLRFPSGGVRTVQTSRTPATFRNRRSHRYHH